MRGTRCAHGEGMAKENRDQEEGRELPTEKKLEQLYEGELARGNAR